MGDITTGLQLHYAFENNVEDSSGNNRDGTPNNSPTYEAGQINQAIVLNGTNQSVTPPSTAATYVTATAGTLAAWVKVQGTPLGAGQPYDLPPIVSDIGGNFGLFRGNISGTGAPSGDRIWAFNWDGNGDRIDITYVVDEWVHVAWVHGGGTLSVYKDGVFVDSVASGNTSSLASAMGIGKGFHATRWLNASIDDLRLYNVAKVADDIADLHALGTPSGVASAANQYFRRLAG